MKKNVHFDHGQEIKWEIPINTQDDLWQYKASVSVYKFWTFANHGSGGVANPNDAFYNQAGYRLEWNWWISHYTFDTDEGERVTDASGSGNDGTVHGATYSNEGKAGGAMSFGGDHEAIIVKNSASLQLQDFSIVAWIKRGDKVRLTKTGSGGGAAVFAYGQAGYGMGIDGNENLVLSKVGINQVASQFKIDDNAWHHVGVTKKGAKVVFYLDGTAYPAPDYDINFEFGTGDAVDAQPQMLMRPERFNRTLFRQGAAVGARGDTLDNSFLGLISDVAVFNRPLSDDEIKGIYARL